MAQHQEHYTLYTLLYDTNSSEKIKREVPIAGIKNILTELEEPQRCIFRAITHRNFDDLNSLPSNKIRWNRLLASLYEQVLVRKGLQLACEKAINIKLLEKDSLFSLSKKFNMFSAMFETIKGSALPIFSGENIDEVLISAPQEIFSLVFFLMFVHVVRTDENSCALIKIECTRENGYFLIIFRRVLSIEDNRSDLTSHNYFDGAHAKVTRDSKLSSASLRLANTLAEKYLSSSISTACLGSISRFLMDSCTLKLPESMCPEEQNPIYNHTVKSFPLEQGIGQKPIIPSFSSQQNQYKASFLLVYDQNKDAESLEFAVVLDSLYLPYEESSAELIYGRMFYYTAVVLREDILEKHYELERLRNIALSVILICSNYSAAQVLYEKYGIKADLLPRNATSDDIFRCVQNVLSSHLPRFIYKEDCRAAVKRINESFLRQSYPEPSKSSNFYRQYFSLLFIL